MNDPTTTIPASACRCAGCAKVLTARKCSRALISRSSPAKFLSSWGRAAAARAFCSSISSAGTAGRRRNSHQRRIHPIAGNRRQIPAGAGLPVRRAAQFADRRRKRRALSDRTPPQAAGGNRAHRRGKARRRRPEGRRGQNAERTFRRHEKARAIARALVIEPQLILYDEPTSELDPLSAVGHRRGNFETQKRIHVTSLVVSHDRDLAFGMADRIAVINEGRILTIGTPDEVKRFNDPLVQKFLHADFQTRNQIKL
jgi:hypothetical protein